MLLRIEHLCTQFSTDEGTVRAVDGVTLSLDTGEILGIVGESGSGKSVTSLSILRLVPDPPGRITAGQIWWDDGEGAPLDLARASFELAPRWTSRTSTSWSPTVMYGLSDVIGSWKIMAIRSPRMRSICRSVAVARSSAGPPSSFHRIRPEVIRPGGSGTSRRIERLSTLLPDPLSPTTPTTSPASMDRLAPLTARTTPSSVKKEVWRSSISRSKAATPSGSAGRGRRAGRRPGS